MTSLRKRIANRCNARRSTGPRTAAGKARVAQNARKHGLRVSALRDPVMTRSIARFARKLAGPTAGTDRFLSACRLVAAQIDLQRIQEAKLRLLFHALEERAAFQRLTALDFYERDVRSQRKSAARRFGPVHAPPRVPGEQAGDPSTGEEEIDLSAVLRKVPARGTALPKHGRAGMTAVRTRQALPRLALRSAAPSRYSWLRTAVRRNQFRLFRKQSQKFKQKHARR